MDELSVLGHGVHNLQPCFLCHYIHTSLGACPKVCLICTTHTLSFLCNRVTVLKHYKCIQGLNMEALCAARKPCSYPLNVKNKKLDTTTWRQAVNTAFILLTLTILPPIFWSHTGSQDSAYPSTQSDQIVPSISTGYYGVY